MPLRPNPNGDCPQVDPTAYVDPSAHVIGHVNIGPRVFVGPNAVLRADEVGPDGQVAPITIGPECNVQDGVIIHALAGTPVTIGARTSLSHGGIVHGPCRIGEGCFIGFGAVVFTADVGTGVFIAARAVVQDINIPADAFVPAASCVTQDQISRLRAADSAEREFMEKVVRMNLTLAANYLAAGQHHPLTADSADTSADTVSS